MTEKIMPFDIASHLHSEEDIKIFLNASAQGGDANDFVHALGIAARARGIRINLYQSLYEDKKPPFEAVLHVCHALGFRLIVSSSPSA